MDGWMDGWVGGWVGGLSHQLLVSPVWVGRTRDGMLRVDMLNILTLVVVVVACGFLENSHCWLRACVLVCVGVFAIDGDARCVCGHDTIQTVD